MKLTALAAAKGAITLSISGVALPVVDGVIYIEYIINHKRCGVNNFFSGFRIIHNTQFKLIRTVGTKHVNNTSQHLHFYPLPPFPAIPILMMIYDIDLERYVGLGQCLGPHK